MFFLAFTDNASIQVIAATVFGVLVFINFGGEWGEVFTFFSVLAIAFVLLVVFLRLFN